MPAVFSSLGEAKRSAYRSSTTAMTIGARLVPVGIPTLEAIAKDLEALGATEHTRSRRGLGPLFAFLKEAKRHPGEV